MKASVFLFLTQRLILSQRYTHTLKIMMMMEGGLCFPVVASELFSDVSSKNHILNS